MKKLISTLLAIMMVLSLAACGSNEGTKTEAQTQEKTEATTVLPVTEAPTTEAPTTEEPTTEAIPSKDELLNNANPLTEFYSIMIDTMNNKSAAKEKYCGKIYIISGYVFEIETDHVILVDKEGTANFVYQLKAYLPVEELSKIQKGQTIRIVGRFTDEIISGTYTFKSSNDTFTTTVFTMDLAYLYD